MTWKEDFLNSVSQVTFNGVADTACEPMYHSLDEKVKKLKCNVISKMCLDPYELPNIVLNDMYDTENETVYLSKIKHQLDTLSKLPIGQDILSNVWSKTYFCAVSLDNFLGKFCMADTPYVILDTSDKVFGNSDDILRILTHELTHAQNEEIQVPNCFYSLPPKLYFMCRIFNELSARFNEKIVLAQKVGQNANYHIISQKEVFEELHKINQKGYLVNFADKTVKRCNNAEEVMVQPALTEENLKMASYYMKLYPVLSNLALIGEMERLYETNVMPIAQNKWPELKGTILSKKSMER